MRLNAIAANKNKQTVGLLYPSVRVNVEKTQLEGGFTLGSIGRRFLGFSRIIAPNRSIGYTVEHCSLKNQLFHNYSFKTLFPQSDTTLGFTLSQPQKIYEDQASLNQSPGFDCTTVKVKAVKYHHQRETLGSLKKSQLSLFVSPFEIEDSSVSLKTTHELTRRVQGRIELKYARDAPSHYGPEVESELKVQVANHVNAYFGLKHSLDGWRFLLGFKVAGIKFRFPLHIVGESHSAALDAS